MGFAGTTVCSTWSVGGRKKPGGSGSAVAGTRVRSAGSASSSCERCLSCPDPKSFTLFDECLRGIKVMRLSGAETLVTEEPYELIAHVRICGGAGWVTTGSTRKPMHLYRHASMTGLARSSAHTASDHATHPSVLVSYSLWTILSQHIIARRSSSGEGYGMPAAARHTCATRKCLI